MSHFRLEFIPVTPLHIGSEEELPGYSYYLENDSWYLYRIDRVMEALPEAARQQLLRVAQKDVMALGGELQQQSAVLKAVADYVGGYSGAAYQFWSEAFRHGGLAPAKRFINNQQGIYIPGSSLKGALRSALLFAAMQPPKRQLNARDQDRLQSETFRYVGAYKRNDRPDKIQLGFDPFRFLKLSDSEPLRNATDLRLLRRFAYHANDHQWEEQAMLLAECTPSSLSHTSANDREITLRATIQIDQPAHEVASDGWPGLWRFDMQSILAACRYFGERHRQSETQAAVGLPALEGAYAALANYAANLPAHAVLLRLGFGSGRDALTVNYAQPEPLVSTSRFLVDDVWPLGWLEMRVFTLDGKPFSTEADLKWQADPLPMAIAPSKTPARKANQAPAPSGQVETERAEKARLESTAQTSSDVWAFLQKKRAKGDGS